MKSRTQPLPSGRGVYHKSKTIAVGAYTWAKLSSGMIREDGWTGAMESYRAFRSGLWRLAGLIYNYGTPIYDHDWDVLIVLDACRADLMAEVIHNYDFIEFGTTDSVGSASPEWMEKNFTQEYADEMHHTAYVTGNPYSKTTIDPARFLLVDDVWADAWNEELGTVTADVMTDRAIDVHRAHNPDRMIVHYMQPHHPFVPNPLDAGMDRKPSPGRFGLDGSVWQALREGRLAHNEVWAAYRENLEYVLDYVELLLESIDADTVVVTSDHGNAFGEHGLYGHPIYVPIKSLKRVPWCITSATDSGMYEPSVPTMDTRHDYGERGIEQKLADLGYL